jgi:hypothetical protein
MDSQQKKNLEFDVEQMQSRRIKHHHILGLPVSLQVE